MLTTNVPPAVTFFPSRTPTKQYASPSRRIPQIDTDDIYELADQLMGGDYVVSADDLDRLCQWILERDRNVEDTLAAERLGRMAAEQRADEAERAAAERDNQLQLERLAHAQTEAERVAAIEKACTLQAQLEAGLERLAQIEERFLLEHDAHRETLGQLEAECIAHDVTRQRHRLAANAALAEHQEHVRVTEQALRLRFNALAIAVTGETFNAVNARLDAAEQAEQAERKQPARSFAEVVCSLFPRLGGRRRNPTSGVHEAIGGVR